MNPAFPNYLFGAPVQITTAVPAIDLTIYAKRELTPEERFEQKVSFVYSCVAGDGITKEQVRKVLAYQ